MMLKCVVMSYKKQRRDGRYGQRAEAILRRLETYTTLMMNDAVANARQVTILTALYLMALYDQGSIDLRVKKTVA